MKRVAFLGAVVGQAFLVVLQHLQVLLGRVPQLQGYVVRIRTELAL
jgi:hypothetical protein